MRSKPCAPAMLKQRAISFLSTHALPMKINLDDPKLTAYALDELSETEKAKIAAAVSDSPEAQEFVREMRLLSEQPLCGICRRAGCASDRESECDPPGTKREAMECLAPLALAAAIALCACLGALAIRTMRAASRAASLLTCPVGRRLLPAAPSCRRPKGRIRP